MITLLEAGRRSATTVRAAAGIPATGAAPGAIERIEID
jgi:hypothetical protein